jgi:oligoendopeptidase F
MAMKKSGKSAIKINPANKGKLRAAAGVKKGQPIPVTKLKALTKSKNPTTRARAQFALNARSFSHRKKG